MITHVPLDADGVLQQAPGGSYAAMEPYLGERSREFPRGTRRHEVLGCRGRFDVSAYSWEVGAAKPDPEFFRRVVRRIGAPAGEVLFVDDDEANVAGAREAGLVVELWHVERGPETLRALLNGHGIELDTG